MKSKIKWIIVGLGIIALIVVTVLFAALHANDTVPSAFVLAPMASGLNRPTALVQPSADADRLFIVEQPGTIRILKQGKLQPTPFLDVTDLLTSAELEQGLLDIAFHPNYAQNGLFFIAYTDKKGQPTLARYHADSPDHADVSSAKIILSVPHPYANHNGGQIAFGPDGYLYFGIGDGGSEGDPLNSGQTKDTLLGSILRIDVDHGDPYSVPSNNPFVHDSAYKAELWAKGLRNPWRFSFDQKTGDLYIADVGGSLYEEIDFQPASSKGGENYGWNRYEGFIGTGDKTGLTFPVAVYDHVSGGCAVIGGYVYRGKTYLALDGTYFYGDYCRGTVWSLKQNADGSWQQATFLSSGVPLTTFGQSNAGELYAADFKGNIYQLMAKSLAN